MTSTPKTVLWFGNAGGPHSTFGMLSLFGAVKALQAVHAETPLELIIVSSDLARYEAMKAALGVPSRFVPWSADAVHAELQGADVSLLTTGDDLFSLVKSANRALLSLTAGVPVVCTPSPSLGPLIDCVQTDYEAGLRRYLTDEAAGAADVAAARAVVEREFALEPVVDKWERALAAAGARGAAERGRHIQHPVVSFLIDLVQDLDVLLPVIDEAGARDLKRQVIVSRRALKEEPRVAAALIQRNIIPTMIDSGAAGRLDARYLRDCDALLMAAESSQAAHAVAHELAGVARRMGVRCASIQHGLEMPGLTISAPRPVRFNSDVVFTWNEPQQLPDFLPEDVRALCIGVGRPRSARARSAGPKSDVLRIGVFENLHWERYTPAYRRLFETCFDRLARSEPAVEFFLRPHPAGRWTQRQPGRFNRPNIRIGGADTGADALIDELDGIITTPSTVALDAAEAGKPTAIFAGEMRALEVYAPLPLLQHAKDWIEFVARVREGGGSEGVDAFLARSEIPGDASGRILDRLSAAAWPSRTRAPGQDPQAESRSRHSHPA